MISGYSVQSLAIPAAFAIVVKATIIVVLAMTAAGVLHRASAARRHLLMAACFGVLLLLPLAIAVMPSTNLRLPAGQSMSPLTIMVFDPGMTTREYFDLIDPQHELGPPPGEPTAGEAWLPAEMEPFAAMPMLWLAWGIGALVCLLPVALALRRTHALRRTAEPWPGGEQQARPLREAAGIGRRIEVVLHEGVSVPLVCGVVRPMIVLPWDARTWSEPDLRHALMHELEHIRRGDWVFHVLTRIVCALYWFHPLVWIAWRRFRLDAERACDDAVVRQSDSHAYADLLVRLAEATGVRPRRQPFLAMVGRGDLSKRVAAILNGARPRQAAGAGWQTAAVVATVVCLAGVAPVAGVFIEDRGLDMTPARVIGLDEVGVRLIPASAPDFDERVRAMVRHGADLALQCKPDLAILVNDSGRTIVAYAPMFLSPFDRRTSLHRYVEAVAGDGTGPVFPRGLEVRPGEQRLVNRVFELDLDADDNSWLEGICGPGAGPRPRPAGTIRLDAVIFADGTLAGVNESRLDEHFGGHLRAHQETLRAVLQQLESGATIENALQAVSVADNSSIHPEKGNPEGYVTFYRGLAVGEVAQRIYRSDVAQARGLLERAIRHEPFRIQRRTPR